MGYEYYNQLGFKSKVLKNFWSKVNIPKDFVNDCWLWNAALNIDGYGAFSIYIKANKRKNYRAHKFVYESYFGKIQNGICVCHRCDVRNCVNPNHLFLGTIKENNKDRDLKGRDYYLDGENHPNTKLFDKDVNNILNDILNDHYNSIDEICKEYKVGLVTIWDILYGKTRRYISKNYDLDLIKAKISRKITKNSKVLIKNDFNEGKNITELVNKYNFTIGQINRAITS